MLEVLNERQAADELRSRPAETCLDFAALSRQAVGRLGRGGVFRYMEREELEAIGALALVQAQAKLSSMPHEDAERLGFVIARRDMEDAVRRNWVRERGRVFVVPRQSDETPEDAWERALHTQFKPDRVSEVQDAIESLPSRSQHVIERHFHHGCTQAEIAAEMRISQQMVGKVLAAAKKTLREVVKQDPSPDIESERGNSATMFTSRCCTGRGMQ